MRRETNRSICPGRPARRTATGSASMRSRGLRSTAGSGCGPEVPARRWVRAKRKNNSAASPRRVWELYEGRSPAARPPGPLCLDDTTTAANVKSKSRRAYCVSRACERAGDSALHQRTVMRLPRQTDGTRETHLRQVHRAIVRGGRRGEPQRGGAARTPPACAASGWGDSPDDIPLLVRPQHAFGRVQQHEPVSPGVADDDALADADVERSGDDAAARADEALRRLSR